VLVRYLLVIIMVFVTAGQKYVRQDCVAFEVEHRSEDIDL